MSSSLTTATVLTTTARAPNSIENPAITTTHVTNTGLELGPEIGQTSGVAGEEQGETS